MSLKTFRAAEAGTGARGAAIAAAFMRGCRFLSTQGSPGETGMVVGQGRARQGAGPEDGQALAGLPEVAQADASVAFAVGRSAISFISAAATGRPCRADIPSQQS